MEYCPSSLVNQREKIGIFSEKEIEVVLKEICVGLDLLHRSSMVHSDIRPENVLISSNGNYKLADFGQAESVGSDNSGGDKNYLAPELLTGEYESSSEKIDIFSLGMTMCALATDLINDEDKWEQLMKGNHTYIDEITHISANMKNLIKNMISLDPSERPSASEIMEHLESKPKNKTQIEWDSILNRLLKIQKAELKKKAADIKKRSASVPISKGLS